MKEAEYFEVDPFVFAGVIFAEQSLNVNFIDTVTDFTAKLGVNTSVGIGQVRLKTAQLVEKETKITKITNYCSKVASTM